jgi:hypothetical protein
MYSVAVYATPMSFPFNFTVHTWVEISDGVLTDRYDLWGYPGLTATPVHGYIYKNLFPNHLGTTLSPFASVNALKKRQTGKVLISTSGEAGSLAAQLYTAITTQILTYPYAHTYHMILGPNCNTFTEWLLRLVPEVNLTLPWYAWGKHYHPQ